jgi:hypothetical protein
MPTVEHALTLKCELRHGDDSVDDVMERLGATGCDDALVGVGRVGRVCEVRRETRGGVRFDLVTNAAA